MATKAWPVTVGVFQDRTLADSAVQELKRAGFDDEQIGYAIKTPDGGHVVDPPRQLGGQGFAGGALLGVLGGAAVGGATGGILGALAAMGIPEEEATRYEGEFQAGRILVTVRADERSDEARAILDRHGGRDVRHGASVRSTTA
jgi:hypothetical protein